MEYDIQEETVDFHGIKVGQASGRTAARLLTANGFHIAASGYTDGSTSWTILLCDDDECPVPMKDAEKAQKLLWDNGWGCVEIVTMPVGV